MIRRVASLLRMQPPVTADRGLLFASGATVPSDGADGYQTGCIFQHTDGGAETALYANEGSVTSCDFNAIKPPDNMELSDLSDVGTLVYAAGALLVGDGDSYEEVVAGYAAQVIQTGTYGNTASGGVVLSTSLVRPFTFLTDDGGASLSSGNYRPLLSRTLLTVDQAGSTITPVRGQLKLNDGVDVGTGIYAAVQGYVELAGDHSAQSGATFSCFDASLEIASGKALTVDSGGEACGIHVETTGAGTITNNGTCAAILIDTASGAANWPYGVYVVGAKCHQAFVAGVQGTGVETTTTYPFAVEIHNEANADITAGSTGSSAGIYNRYAIITAQTSQCNHISMFGKLRVKANMADGNHAAGYFYVEQSGTVTVSGTATTCTAAVVAAIETSSGFTLSTGHLNGIYINSSVNASSTITGTMAALRIGKSTSAKAWPTGITLESGACDKLISGTCTMSGSTALNSIEITTTSATTHSSGYERSIYVSHTHQTSNATGSSEVNVIAADLQCTSNITQAYCFTAYTGSMAGATVNRVAHYAGYLDAITGTVNASSVAFFETNGGATYNSFIALRRHGGTIHAVISDTSGGLTATNLFEFTNATGPATVAGGTYSTAEGYFTIKVGGATYRMPFYSGTD